MRCGFRGADGLLHALEEILFEDVRLKRAARFAGHNENSFGEIEFRLDGFDLSGRSGVQNQKLRMAGNSAKCEFQDFDAQAGAAHAEKHSVGKTLGSDFLGNLPEPIDIRSLILSDGKPSEPLAFVGVGPQRGVARPEALDLIIRTPIIQRGLDCLGEISRQLIREACGSGWRSFLNALLDSGEKLIESFGKKFDAVFGKLVGDGLHGDSRAGEIAHGLTSLIDIFLEAGARLAVVAERVKRGRRDGIHRVGTDQFFDIKNVAVGGILRAGAGPEEALRGGTALGQGLPTWAIEDSLVEPIGELGVGNGDFALQPTEESAVDPGRRILDEFSELAIDEGVDAADEEAGNAGDAADVAITLRKILQASENASATFS